LSEFVETVQSGRTQPTVGKRLGKIEGELDIIFSELPAKPWPVKGFGAPGVESRFRDKRT